MSEWQEHWWICSYILSRASHVGLAGSEAEPPPHKETLRINLLRGTVLLQAVQ